MSEGKAIILHCESFGENLSNVFKKLRNASSFYDVTLGCSDSNGRLLQAHKVVISAFSAVLDDMIRQDASINSKNNLSLFFRGISHQDLTSILDFIYQGEAFINEEHVASFLSVAEDLKIEGLSNIRISSSEHTSDQIYNDRNERSPNTEKNNCKVEKSLNSFTKETNIQNSSELNSTIISCYTKRSRNFQDCAENKPKYIDQMELNSSDNCYISNYDGNGLIIKEPNISKAVCVSKLEGRKLSLKQERMRFEDSVKPKSVKKRCSFQNGWLDKFPWLVQSDDPQRGFCTHCLSDFSVKRGTYAVHRHGTTDEHKRRASLV